MAQEIKWCANHIEIPKPKRPKKITGTRLAAIMGANNWTTPFEAWCAITRTYEKPFEDTIYTIAGKTIEPKQAAYVRDYYGMPIVTPEMQYGSDYFKTTRGDFFPENPIFGGMWDYLTYKDGKPNCVFEMKTTKRSEDWKYDVPVYYALQAALYAHLLNVDTVIMVVSFLEDSDYANPEQFKPSIRNTKLIKFNVHDKFPLFRDIMDYATEWWQTHVIGGKSPEFDEKKDAEILKALRTASAPVEDIKEMLRKYEALKSWYDVKNAEVKDLKSQVDDITAALKEYAKGLFKDGYDTVALKGDNYDIVVSKSQKRSINTDALEADGLLEKYSTMTDTYTIRAKVREV